MLHNKIVYGAHQTVYCWLVEFIVLKWSVRPPARVF